MEHKLLTICSLLLTTLVLTEAGIVKRSTSNGGASVWDTESEGTETTEAAGGTGAPEATEVAGASVWDTEPEAGIAKRSASNGGASVWDTEPEGTEATEGAEGTEAPEGREVTDAQEAGYASESMWG